MHSAEDFDSRHESGLQRTVWRQHQPHALLLTLQGQRRSQGSADRAQGTCQGQLSCKLIIGEPLCIDLPAGRQNSQRYRQVKAA
ncbi:hypothetical protein SDC9_206413 [bioreactor metagenome]|uniref:Uncharacterized protein n=1 Tax=bioreactor metagenome TaxID=1076179 RepID=A0A645J6F7_9ZZZZ